MIVDRDTVKLILQIDTDRQDALIDVLIPQVEAQYEEIRNLPFAVDEHGDAVYPPDAALTASLMVGHYLQAPRIASGLQSQSLGDYSYTEFAQTGDLPEKITRRIRKYVRTL